MIRTLRCLTRTAAGGLAFGALVFLPAMTRCEIQEVADAGGKVVYYKYTDKNGSIVFTDLLAKIPEEYRRNNKVVRIGPPPKKAAPIEPQAPQVPPVPEAPTLPLNPVPPDTRAPLEEASGGSLWLKTALALVLALAGVVVYRLVSAQRRQPPRRPGNSPAGRERVTARAVDPARNLGNPQAEQGRPETYDGSPARENPQEVLNRLLQLGDFSAAARLCEAQGDLERAAGYHLESGNVGRAREIYLELKDYRPAAELAEKAGDFLQAAANHLQAGNAGKAAECFEKGGDLMQAATIFQEAGDLAKAGELFFQAGFFEEAGESFSLLNDPARAAEAYERAGKYLQAAQASEKAGAGQDKLAALYEKGEDYHAAGRLFVKLGQLDRALHALQQVAAASMDYPAASLLVGMIFLKRGQTNLAYEKFMTIINNQPLSKANLEPYYFLARCYEQAGDAQNARAIFTRILAEDYNFRDVRLRVAQPSARS